MSKEIFVTEKAPAPVGPYSQAVASGPFLFCSGQISLSAEGELFLGDIQEQTRKVMANIGEVLKAADLTYSHIVKTTIFLVDMNDFAKVNEVYATYFQSEPPARSTIAVSALPKGVHVEIEVIAAR